MDWANQPLYLGVFNTTTYRQRIDCNVWISCKPHLRIIYLYVSEVSRFLLLDVYSKDEADDLAPEERKFLAGLAEEYRAEAIAAGTRRKQGFSSSLRTRIC